MKFKTSQDKKILETMQMAFFGLEAKDLTS
jgi:hypothetical protein